jgi:hypothetical protein
VSTLLYVTPVEDFYCLTFEGIAISRAYETQLQAAYAVDVILSFLRTSGIKDITKFVNPIVEFTKLAT